MKQKRVPVATDCRPEWIFVFPFCCSSAEPFPGLPHRSETFPEKLINWRTAASVRTLGVGRQVKQQSKPLQKDAPVFLPYWTFFILIFVPPSYYWWSKISASEARKQMTRFFVRLSWRETLIQQQFVWCSIGSRSPREAKDRVLSVAETSVCTRRNAKQ